MLLSVHGLDYCESWLGLRVDGGGAIGQPVSEGRRLASRGAPSSWRRPCCRSLSRVSSARPGRHRPPALSKGQSTTGPHRADAEYAARLSTVTKAMTRRGDELGSRHGTTLEGVDRVGSFSTTMTAACRIPILRSPPSKSFHFCSLGLLLRSPLEHPSSNNRQAFPPRTQVALRRAYHLKYLARHRPSATSGQDARTQTYR